MDEESTPCPLYPRWLVSLLSCMFYLPCRMSYVASTSFWVLGSILYVIHCISYIAYGAWCMVCGVWYWYMVYCGLFLAIRTLALLHIIGSRLVVTSRR